MSDWSWPDQFLHVLILLQQIPELMSRPQGSSEELARVQAQLEAAQAEVAALEKLRTKLNEESKVGPR